MECVVGVMYNNLKREIGVRILLEFVVSSNEQIPWEVYELLSLMTPNYGLNSRTDMIHHPLMTSNSEFNT